MRPAPNPRVLARAPDELTRGRLERIGEGVGKVVFGSEHWVVKRERSPTEIIALIFLWRGLRIVDRLLPDRVRERLTSGPSREIRFLRVILQAFMRIMPRSFWFMTHAGEIWRDYHWQSVRGETLAASQLTGTNLIPERVMFPPTRVKVDGWPGWLLVHEAIERVETTLFHYIERLAREDRFKELESWLNRWLDTRQNGWERGLFSVDMHLKNYGVCDGHIVLIDAGGLTNTWAEVEKRLEQEEEVAEPHVRLGLGQILKPRPDIALRFNVRWKAMVNREHLREHWPAELL